MKIDHQHLYQLEAANTRRLFDSQSSSASSTKYHRAAIDGYVDMLCDVSKRDTNLSNEEDGLTPTLLAAQSGHLDALRILVGRGGDPEKTAADGSSALHLASVRGHLNCVSFLVNFGVNMWSLDNDLHTAKDVAAIEQRKEVLDFLDSMMAKQSALNTKNVQKLKEKAKVAAEKRIKQLRKAQLKAIKQVEKDERYLKKLSHNRRLLKAAHSISDIKLVGRHPQPPASGSGCMSGSGESGGASGSISSASHLSSSPSLANLINHKLQMDLLGFRYNNARQQQQHQQGPMRLLSRRSTGTGSTTDESSYSTSSVSSHLSTSNGRTSNPNRPKYSDLVAVNGAELARWHRQKPTTPMTTSAASKQQEQQSLKSTSTGISSTIGNKLWGIGGVSRKVQLRRLLKAGAQSSSDLTNISAGPKGGNSTTISNEAPANINLERVGARLASKLCNVQPTMRLKLNAAERKQLDEAAEVQQRQEIGKMTRAISEPDFRAALLRSPSDDDDDDDDEGSDSEEILNNTTGKTHDKQMDIPAQTWREKQLPPQTVQQQMAKAESMELTHSKPTNMITNSEIGSQCQSNEFETHSSSSRPQNQAKSREDSQHQQLLTQCLSQLKLRHEELTSMRSHNEQFCSSDQREITICDADNQLLRPSKLANASRLAAADIGKQHQVISNSDFFDSSDELIKHQLMAGEFPLRPSLIKQKQQQLTKEQVDNRKPVTVCNVHSGGNRRTAGSTTISVDSIGSAGSFAKRNTCSSNVSAKSSSNLSTSSYSSSSCSTSSIEMAAAAAATAIAPAIIEDRARMGPSLVQDDHSQHISPPAPPLPPPLPPKNLSLAPVNYSIGVGGNVNITRQQQQSKQQRQSGASTSESKVANNDNELSTIESFLKSNGLEDLSEVFAKEKIDLEALVLLNEEDLKSLNILLGPRRKLLKAIGMRKRWAKTRKGDDKRETNVSVTKPMYIMVDTPL